MTHKNSNYSLISTKIISELAQNSSFYICIYIIGHRGFGEGNLYAVGEGNLYASLEYNLQKSNFHMTTKNTFLDLMAVLKLNMLSSFMINELQVSEKEMLSLFCLRRAHFLLISIAHKCR